MIINNIKISHNNNMHLLSELNQSLKRDRKDL